MLLVDHRLHVIYLMIISLPTDSYFLPQIAFLWGLDHITVVERWYVDGVCCQWEKKPECPE